MANAIESAINQTRDTLEAGSEELERGEALATAYVHDRMPIMGEIRLIGGALVFLLLIVFVLTEIYNAVEFETENGEYTGPFGSIVDDLESIGAVALSLIVLALLVVAAAAIMRFFGQSGFGGR